METSLVISSILHHQRKHESNNLSIYIFECICRELTSKWNSDLLSFKMYKRANKSSVSTSVSKIIRRGSPSTKCVLLLINPTIIVIHKHMFTHLWIFILFFSAILIFKKNHFSEKRHRIYQIHNCCIKSHFEKKLDDP